MHSTPNSSIGIALDIDGVIQTGHHLIPIARPAVQLIHEMNIPFIFLTNGGGHSESHRKKILSSVLEIPIHTDQVCLSHTPFRNLTAIYGNSRVLIIGRNDNNMKAAKEYGFTDAIYIDELSMAFPFLFLDRSHRPHRNMFDSIQAEYSQPLPQNVHEQLIKCLPGFDIPIDYKPVEAILFFQTPTRFLEAVQIVYSLLSSGGDLLYPLYLQYWGKRGYSFTKSTGKIPPEWPFNEKVSIPLPTYYSNPDKFFSTPYPLPHLTLGYIKKYLEQGWPEYHDNAEEFLQKWKPHLKVSKELSVFMCGKPCPIQYNFAGSLLEIQRQRMADPSEIASEVIHTGSLPKSSSKEILGHLWTMEVDKIPPQKLHDGVTKTVKQFSHVYMVGDSIKSDITGACNAGSPWIPMLVKTGLYKSGPAIVNGYTKPIQIFDNVLGVVIEILQTHGYSVPKKYLSLLSSGKDHAEPTNHSKSGIFEKLHSRKNKHSSIRPVRPPTMVKPMIKFTCLSFQDFSGALMYDYLALRSQVFVVEQSCVFLDTDGLSDRNATHIVGQTAIPFTIQGDPADPQMRVHCCARWIDSTFQQHIGYPENPNCSPDQTSTTPLTIIHFGRVITSIAIRNFGIGRDLVLECIKLIEKQYGRCRVDIVAQSYLERFYSEFGWKVQGKRFLLDGIYHTPMSLDIVPSSNVLNGIGSKSPI